MTAPSPSNGIGRFLVPLVVGALIGARIARRLGEQGRVLHHLVALPLAVATGVSALWAVGALAGRRASVRPGSGDR